MKKSKAFKFASKSKDKREKSRDKDKSEKELKEKEKVVAADSKEKKKDKDKKEKDKKEKTKEKDKEKKDKKLKQASVSEEILELGGKCTTVISTGMTVIGNLMLDIVSDAHPIFGVSLGLALVRSHCHDNINLPLVVRDCIDYLQEHGLQSEQLYKVDPVKTKLQHLKKLYNNRETNGVDDFDVPTACGLLKLFIR